MDIEDMISAVQKKLGVQVDGRAGTETWGAIYAHIVKPTIRGESPAEIRKGTGSTLVQNKFLKCLRLVSRMGGSSTPVCGVATPCHPQAGGIVW